MALVLGNQSGGETQFRFTPDEGRWEKGISENERANRYTNREG